MTVFVVQDQPHKNFLPAQKFGKLVALLEATNIVASVELTMEKLEKRLAAFSDSDYILAIGDPLAIGLACIIAARNNSGKFKMLKWDRQTATYYAVDVNTRKAEQ